jgi:cell division protein FtsZ
MGQGDNLMIEFEQESLHRQKSMVSIKVIGVGGAGGNAVNSIIESGCQGIGFVVANTDAQALEFSKAQHKIQIGVKSTKGLGAGANPDMGKRAAEEDLDKVMDAVSGADIVFIVGGMGGGTGSGGLPVIARALRDKGVLVIAIVTRPFLFEGKRRSAIAEEAIQRLKQDVDTLIVIPNQKLLEVVDQHVSMIDAFALINEGILSQSVRGLSDIITRPGHINVDYADIRTIMKDRGLAVMGTGKASGKNRARLAALAAISSPLLENMSVEGAHGVLCNITGGKGLGLHEISEAASVVYEQAHEDANIIIGSVIDDTLQDEVIVTIIATDFERSTIVAPEKEEVICTQAIAVCPQEPLEQILFEATPLQAQEPIMEPLPLIRELQEEEEIIFEVEEDIREDAVIEKKSAFSYTLDSKDLDIPSFMRHRND